MTPEEIRVIEFDERYAKNFADLNYQWIAEDYGIEPHDHDLLDHPVAVIISPGGQILFVLVGEQVAGTVAMIPMGDDAFELAKMAVDPSYRGRGLGDKLMQACVDFARASGRRSVILESNTKQVPAIQLYRKFGFEEVPRDPNTHYVRSNIRMELVVN